MLADDEQEKLPLQLEQSTRDDSTVAETEDIDAQFTAWESLIYRLRLIADRTRWLAAQLTPYHGTDIETNLRWVVEEFRHTAGSVKRADLESLILDTTELHHRAPTSSIPTAAPIRCRLPSCTACPRGRKKSRRSATRGKAGSSPRTRFISYMR